MTIYTRSSNLSDQLDKNATEQVGQMVDHGWEPTAAAIAWVDYVQVVAESAADAALLEGSWEAS